MSYFSRGERISVGVKAHVLFSRLLTADEYWMLLGSDTVVEVAQKLVRTAYADVLSTLPPEPHRYDLEGAVKDSLMQEAEHFQQHLGNPRDRFFRTWMLRYEAENLKSIFRYVAAHRSDREDLRRRLYPIHSSKVAYDNLLGARDFAEAADVLRGTPYHKVLVEPMKRLESGMEQSLFSMEMALDSYIESELWACLHKLERGEREMLLPIFGMRVDLYNLYFLYRALEFYNLTPAETLTRLLPVRYKVSLPFLRSVSHVSSFEEISGRLKEQYPVYAAIFEEGLQGDAIQLALDRNIKRFLHIQAHKVFSTGSPDFHTAMGYFVLKEFELNDITRIIESVRYGYDRRLAAEYLIRPILAGGEAEWQY